MSGQFYGGGFFVVNLLFIAAPIVCGDLWLVFFAIQYFVFF